MSASNSFHLLDERIQRFIWVEGWESLRDAQEAAIPLILKADRATRTLLVPGAYAEPDAPPETGERLAAELRRLAGWLGLEDVVVAPRGDLAPALAALADVKSTRIRAAPEG